jgi:hypothetical protein
MNIVTALPMQHVWHNPFAGFVKTVTGKVISIEKASEELLPFLVLGCALIIAFSGILNLGFIQELFAGIVNGTLWSSGFFQSLPLNHF